MALARQAGQSQADQVNIQGFDKKNAKPYIYQEKS